MVAGIRIPWRACWTESWAPPLQFLMWGGSRECIFNRCSGTTLWKMLFSSLQTLLQASASLILMMTLCSGPGPLWRLRMTAGMWSCMVSDQRRDRNSWQPRHCLGVQSLGIYLCFLVKNNHEAPVPDTSLYPNRAFMYNECCPDVPSSWSQSFLSKQNPESPALSHHVWRNWLLLPQSTLLEAAPLWCLVIGEDLFICN